MNDAYKIFRFILFLIPVVIILLYSLFVGKKKAAANFFRFKLSFKLGILFLVLIAALFWILYVLTIDKNQEDKKYIKTDLIIFFILLIVFAINLYWWSYVRKMNNNTVSKFQVLNIVGNGLKTARNMSR